LTNCFSKQLWIESRQFDQSPPVEYKSRFGRKVFLSSLEAKFRFRLRKPKWKPNLEAESEADSTIIVKVSSLKPASCNSPFVAKHNTGLRKPGNQRAPARKVQKPFEAYRHTAKHNGANPQWTVN